MEGKKEPAGREPGDGRGSGEAPPRLSKKLTRGVPDPYMKGRRDALIELRASGGLGQSQLALEVLYCLPDQFVKAYEELFLRALPGTSQGAVSGKGVEHDRGSGRAMGNKEGIVLGSKSALQAAGGGKKWKPGSDGGIGGEKAMNLKMVVDRELLALAQNIGRELRRKSDESSLRAAEDRLSVDLPGTTGDLTGTGSTAGTAGTARTKGSGGKGSGAGGVAGSIRCIGHGCGRFMKDEWRYCPACGTERLTSL